MKKLLALAILGIVTVGFATGPVDAATKKGPKITGIKTLDPVKGRFHRLHTRNLKLQCGSCHSSNTQDLLFLRRNEPVPANMPGQVNRKVCLSCHQTPGKPTWYGAAKR